MNLVKLYSTDFCPFCSAAKNLLKGKGVDFEEIKLTSFEDKAALTAKTGWPTVPQIFIGEEFIGGFEELRALEEKGDLIQKLNEAATS
jgi:glutaredoxin 3